MPSSATFCASFFVVGSLQACQTHQNEGLLQCHPLYCTVLLLACLATTPTPSCLCTRSILGATVCDSMLSVLCLSFFVFVADACNRVVMFFYGERFSRRVYRLFFLFLCVLVKATAAERRAAQAESAMVGAKDLAQVTTYLYGKCCTHYLIVPASNRDALYPKCDAPRRVEGIPRRGSRRKRFVVQTDTAFCPMHPDLGRELLHSRIFFLAGRCRAGALFSKALVPINHMAAPGAPEMLYCSTCTILIRYTAGIGFRSPLDRVYRRVNLEE